MSEKVIVAEQLSKRYEIGRTRHRHDRIKDALADGLRRLDPRRRRRAAAAGAEPFWALREVSFEISRGEVVGIIGRNGAGKSTLLKILSRITRPTSGRATIDGRVGSLLEVGTGFDRELTGRENIFLNGAILGMRKVEIERQFDQIVEFAGVATFLDTPVKHYSSGMYVRLAFAVAAHLDPEILIIDEVLAVGDAEFQKKCLGKMKDVSRSGRTVLFVSHNMPAVRALCSRVLLLADGEVSFSGAPSGAVSQYLSGDVTDAAERTWLDPDRAPGCPSLRLRKVRIVDALGHCTRHIDIDEPFTIEVEYRVLQEGIKAGVTVILTSDEGYQVFSSLSNLDPYWHGRCRPAGLFSSSCGIPADLLNSGRHSVSVLLWKDHYAISSREDDVLTCELHDTAAIRGDYLGVWPGAVRPRLQWQTRKVDEEVASEGRFARVADADRPDEMTSPRCLPSEQLAVE